MPLSIAPKLCGLMYVFKKEKTIYKTSCSCWGSGIQEHLSWMVRISHKVSVKLLTEGTVIWMLDWSWRFGSHAGQVGAGCWQVALVHHMDLSIGLLECPHDMGAVFPQSELREGKLSTTVLWPDLESHTHFYNILFVTHVSPVQCGRKLHNDRRQGSVGVIYKTLRVNVSIK